MMGAMTDDSTDATTAAGWVVYERTDRLACLREAADVAATYEMWDARDIAVWAEYIRTGAVLEYTPSVLEEAARSTPPREEWGRPVAVPTGGPAPGDG